MPDLAVDKYHLCYFEHLQAEHHLHLLKEVLLRATTTNQLTDASEKLIASFDDLEAVTAITDYGSAKVRWLEIHAEMVANPLDGNKAFESAELLLDAALELTEAWHWADEKLKSRTFVPSARSTEMG